MGQDVPNHAGISMFSIEDGAMDLREEYGFHLADKHASAVRSSDSAALTAALKTKALELGADMVGVCALDPLWLRSENDLEGAHADVNWTSVVVIVVAMDARAFRSSPSPDIRTATNEGYRRMANVAVRLGRHVAGLGYNALSAGNQQALSVPLAVDAGLGRLGRNGMLLTEPFGSCVRICKVFSAAPLVPDEPAADPLDARCPDCTLCAEACPVTALEMTCAPATGLWKLDASRCRPHWNSINKHCAACITACPATG